MPITTLRGNVITVISQRGKLKYIEMAWKLVAEDYAPFNVDVMMEEQPLGYLSRKTRVTEGGPCACFSLRALMTRGLARMGNDLGWQRPSFAGIGSYDA